MPWTGRGGGEAVNREGCRGQGQRRAGGLPGQEDSSAGWPCQAPRWPRSGGGGPRLLSGIFRRGNCRRFLCPSFRFPLARPRHSWRERCGGGGSRSWTYSVRARVASGTPPPRAESTPGRLERAVSGQALSPLGPGGKRSRPGTPGHAGVAVLQGLRLAVGGSGHGVPGALLSAGLLCLGSFIWQLLRPGRASWPPPPSGPAASEATGGPRPGDSHSQHPKLKGWTPPGTTNGFHTS